MLKKTPASLALLCVVLALALAATTVSAQYGSGFAVVSGKSLWVYGDPSSLDMWLANKVPLSLTANPVSAAAGSPYGGFVVAAPSQLLSYNVTQWVGDELTGQLISDLAFVPRANNVRGPALPPPSRPPLRSGWLLARN
jgi:hypothetical protein